MKEQQPVAEMDHPKDESSETELNKEPVPERAEKCDTPECGCE